ncbi:MAG: hypothetical protein LBS01_05870 [Prevotellaceae bacterium]|jgi:hypothetical protein|nr:hypothetical protein [Prevotellaceae bacterium]
MKKVFSILFAAALLCSANGIKAQNASEGGFMDHLGVGLNYSFLKGEGISVHFSLLPILKARVGLNYFGLGLVPSLIKEQSFEADSYDGTQAESVSGEINKAGIAMINGSILADYYPFGGNTVFSITGGVFIGTDRVNVSGKADGDFSFEGVKIKPNADGTFKGHISMGSVIKPYIGIGLGKTIPNKRVGFRWDLGMIYQGKFGLYSDNAGGKFTLDDSKVGEANDGYKTVLDMVTLAVYPQMTFTLSYRIF